MTLLELVARTFSPQLPDGRFVFRPWGPSGPCYLLSAQQRAARAKFQLVFYGLAIAAISFAPAGIATTRNLVACAVAFALCNYVLYWLFSIGLPKTDKPLRPSREQRRVAMAEHSRALGRPLLWTLLVLSCVFVIAGGAMALLFDKWLAGLLGLAIFGASAALFAWQLSLIGGSDT